MTLESDGGMISTGENRRTRRKTCPSATLSTTNPTWIHPGVNPVLRGVRPATNHLSHGAAQRLPLIKHCPSARCTTRLQVTVSRFLATFSKTVLSPMKTLSVNGNVTRVIICFNLFLFNLGLYSSVFTCHRLFAAGRHSHGGIKPDWIEMKTQQDCEASADLPSSSSSSIPVTPLRSTGLQQSIANTVLS
jgi:hypothetical protein